MKVVIDKHIPFIRGVIEPYADVVYVKADKITPEIVNDADALFIRTRTRIDKALLADSVCRFVATATIGMDQFDLAWCGQNGVTAVNAPGCNAPAVAQYVFAAIGRLATRPLNELSLAVVGVGNVGKVVERWARGLNMNVILVDPPRQQMEGGTQWKSLEDAAARADIISFHTPLLPTTFHLGNKDFFNSLKRKPIIINAARGPVVDNTAWVEAIDKGLISGSVVDVWEGEPLVNRKLMWKADFSTPHIAGYSLDGKIRATQMVLDAFSKHFNLPALKACAPAPAPIPETIPINSIIKSYDPAVDTEMMRSALSDNLSEEATGKIFENLRDTYNLRNECQ